MKLASPGETPARRDDVLGEAMKRAFLLAAAVLAATVLPAAAQQSPQWHYMFGDRFVDAIVANPAANAALNGARPLINIETIESPRDNPPGSRRPRLPTFPRHGTRCICTAGQANSKWRSTCRTFRPGLRRACTT